MRRRDLAVLLLVLLAVAAAYRPVLDNGFIDLDDVDYILQNPKIANGLTAQGAAWALTATKPWNWHPLTWLSHMADVSLFGLDPRGHHATSLLLHLANVSLAFVALRALTGWLWRSAGAAALLGLHPVHVEAVAWASERKGMLSSFFFLLALCAWARHVRRPGPARYAAVMLALAASLMSKQMAVTLPLLLLALDFWPLGRLGGAPAGGGPRGPLPSAAGARGALLEKLPLLALSAAAVLLAVLTQASGGAVMTLTEFTLPQRLGNALLSCWAYLGSLVWPAGLAIFYVHPQASISWAAVAAAGAALLAATAAAVAHARRRPWLAACLAWYLVSLVPVLGILQLGWHARADRYVYLPFILVYLGALTAAAALVRDLPRGRLAAGVAAVAVLACLGALTWRQAGFWKGDIPLFERAIAVTGENWFAESNLGAAWIKRGRMDLGIPHWRAAVRLNRDFAIIKPRR